MELPLYIVQCAVIIESNLGMLIIRPIMDGEHIKPGFPNGKVNESERITEAAVRIAQELTGLEVEPTDILSIHKVQKTVTFNLYAKVKGEPSNLSEENLPTWVTTDTLEHMVKETSDSASPFGSPSNLVKAREILDNKRYPLALLEPFI